MDAALDCPQVCSRYRDCFDSNYNTDTCVERCNANAKNSSDFYRSVNTCQACISDRSCGSATFSCAGECVSVVP